MITITGVRQQVAVVAMAAMIVAPMLVWYMPVMMAEREAEQTGPVTKALVNLAPSPASLSSSAS